MKTTVSTIYVQTVLLAWMELTSILVSVPLNGKVCTLQVIQSKSVVFISGMSIEFENEVELIKTWKDNSYNCVLNCLTFSLCLV